MTCDSDSAPVWPDKHPNATLDYAIDFEEDCVRQWEQFQDCPLGLAIRVFRAGQASGSEFRATTAGRTGGRHPAFLVGQPTIDGSVIWTPQSISSASVLSEISGTPTWAGDDGVTISNVTVTGFKAISRIAGGVDGADYEITVTAVRADGIQIVKTAILPVRVPARLC